MNTLQREGCRFRQILLHRLYHSLGFVPNVIVSRQCHPSPPVTPKLYPLYTTLLLLRPKNQSTHYFEKAKMQTLYCHSQQTRKRKCYARQAFCTFPTVIAFLSRIFCMNERLEFLAVFPVSPVTPHQEDLEKCISKSPQKCILPQHSPLAISLHVAGQGEKSIRNLGQWIF